VLEHGAQRLALVREQLLARPGVAGDELAGERLQALQARRRGHRRAHSATPTVAATKSSS
jgi:hypothetical protein